MRIFTRCCLVGFFAFSLTACSLPRGAALVQEVVREQKAAEPSFEVVEVTRADGADHIAVQVEADGGDADAIAASVQDILKLRADVTLLAPGALPRDGVVIADLRPIES